MVNEGGSGIQLLAVQDDEGYVLTGEKWHVSFASSAERLVVPVRTGDDPTAVGTSGKPAKKDNKPAGGGTGFQDIG